MTERDQLIINLAEKIGATKLVLDSFKGLGMRDFITMKEEAKWNERYTELVKKLLETVSPS